MSKEANTSKSNNKKHRHHYSVLPYITVPLVFVLISMIVVAPACFVGMNVAIKAVHSAQQVLAKDYNDLEAITEYVGSNEAKGSATIPDLHTAQKLGVVTCKPAGLNADVFNGINRVSLRNGAGLDTKGSYCGAGGSVLVYGYASTSFKGLKNISVNDTVDFETLWGKYTYKVTSISISEDTPKFDSKEALILATEADDTAFSAFNKQKLYVVAEKLSGPKAEEVAQ